VTLVAAGAGGDSGKTLVSLGLAAVWRRAGLDVRAFKKGPDYIDAAWLTRAAGRPARNLDAWIMGEDTVRRSFARHAATGDVSLVEGNRGLFDGLDGTSTAALAHLLGAPVLLVLDITKTTRTAAAFVAGCRALDPGLTLAGVVLNRVGGPRHLREARRAVEKDAGVRVVGAIPKLKGANLLPDRHLGLVPPEEHDRMAEVVDRLGDVIRENVDTEVLLDLARTRTAAPVAPDRDRRAPQATEAEGNRARIGVFRDAAFTFYYPENLEALEDAGAELVPISALEDPGLPPVDLLYIGGGFPETHAGVLSENGAMLRSVKQAVGEGLPVYAECGGLIYLSRSVRHKGRTYPLAGVLDTDTEVMGMPQGHGYVEAVVDRPNPFFTQGTRLRGHEFHYGRLAGRLGADPDRESEPATALRLERGTGCHSGRDGLVQGCVLASWMHIHALGAPGWADALVRRAKHPALPSDKP
jgi:cobyrinic acid a,c-diamide synthase